VVEKATPGKRRSKERISTPLPLKWRGTKVKRPKLEERRQTLLYLGSDCRKVVRRRALDTIEVKASVFIVEAVTAAQVAGSGVERFRVLVSKVGCRVRGEASSR
jgi:hypothetical protein